MAIKKIRKPIRDHLVQTLTSLNFAEQSHAELSAVNPNYKDSWIESIEYWEAHLQLLIIQVASEIGLFSDCAADH